MKHRSLMDLMTKEFLFEAKEPEQEPGDSIDSQIDKFLIDYETEAKRSKNEGLDFRMITRRLLREEEEEDTDGAEEDDADDSEEDDADGAKDDDADDADDADKETKKSPLDELNMESYVASVMRLVDNYDNLLEVRNTILRRAKNYLVKNYEPEALNSFDDNLRETYGMEVGEMESERQDKFQPPKAGAAGPMGGGA